MARKKKKKSINYYVLYGFNKSDKDITGYFDCNNKITTELSCAKLFPSENIFKVKGFSEPEKWVEFINTDKYLNNGYKFHLVRVSKHPKIKS